MIQDPAALFQSRQTSNNKLLFITLHPCDYLVVFLLLQLVQIAIRVCLRVKACLIRVVRLI